MLKQLFGVEKVSELLVTLGLMIFFPAFIFIFLNGFFAILEVAFEFWDSLQ